MRYVKPRLYWRPANAQGTRWELMFEFDWTRRIAQLQRGVNGGWEVPVDGGTLLFAREAIDRAVHMAERDGCDRYGLTPPHWRAERIRLTREAQRGTLRA